MPRRPESGFSLTELMVVVVIIGVLVAVAVFGARRPIADSQLQAAANNFKWALLGARQRAVAKHYAYYVEISPTSGFRYCQATSKTVTTPGTTCIAGEEESPWVKIGDQVILAGFARVTNVGDSTGTAFTSTVRLLVGTSGAMDSDLTTPPLDGFTLYLQTTEGKRRKVYVWALTCQNHSVDRW